MLTIQIMNFLYITPLTPRFLESLCTPAVVCSCNSSIQKSLWKQHELSYGVLIAVLNIFDTLNFH
jgi:hypothetical protein